MHRAGVTWHQGRWRARIYLHGHQHELGFFDDEELAAQAYDEAAKQVLPDPVLNFLPDGSVNPDHKGERGRYGGWM
jgi:hypothetical protein